MTIAEAPTQGSGLSGAGTDPAAPSGPADVLAAVRGQVRAVCARAREAARALATAPRAVKDAALLAVADDLVAATDSIVAANAQDLARGEQSGMAAGLLDRLRLDAGRVFGITNPLPVHKHVFFV